MANKPGNDDRAYGMRDREAQRGGSDHGRSAASGGSSGGSGSSNGGQSRSRSNRGFASMDPGKQREIASKGGRAAHAKGTAHEFDSSEAREAGRKGGLAVSQNREHMAKIGRRGGEARGATRGRGSAQVNAPGAEGNEEGAYQNPRNALEREVNVRSGSEGVTSDGQGSRGGNSSLGGERRPTGTDAVRDVRNQ